MVLSEVVRICACITNTCKSVKTAQKREFDVSDIEEYSNATVHGIVMEALLGAYERREGASNSNPKLQILPNVYVSDLSRRGKCLLKLKIIINRLLSDKMSLYNPPLFSRQKRYYDDEST